MTKEDTIIVPRWFLEVVEDTLRIENNINEPDKKETGESCQDRNIRQSLNGIRKLLKGEELTGMERLEKLQPSIPSNLDEAAIDFADNARKQLFTKDYAISSIADYDHGRIDGFKAGAEWMAGQGINLPAHIFIPSDFKPVYDYSKGEYPAAVHLDCGGSLILEKQLQNFNHNEEVIVQIRKK